jgi:hypothetical protein
VANNIAGREQMTAMQQQINALHSILELARGPGIRIAQQSGGVSLPAASVQFGAATA